MFPLRKRYNRGRFDLPPLEVMRGSLFADSDPLLRQMVDARRSGSLELGERTIAIGEEAISIPEMAILYHYAKDANASVTYEIGFGLGMSAAVILAARAGKKHTVYDPYLLKGKSEPILDHIVSHGLDYRSRRSDFALAETAEKLGRHTDLIFIDGGHQIENTFVDFTLADQNLLDGGHIILDDARYPAIESVISYIYSNRIDYDILDAVHGFTILRKVGDDERSWDHFQPFNVPKRRNWARRR